MAGGAGVRLRPLTCMMPKPLVPILEKPVMEYTLLLLRRHGIRDVTATVCYKGQQIRQAFGNGHSFGMKLHYIQEDVPHGTAGSILPLQKRMQDTFIVLSGDALTDCDLQSALRFHKAQKALATLILKKVPNPLQYGVVLTDAQHRITQFIEKPAWQQVFSDLANTGIYLFEPEIFDYIPSSGTPDFSKDVFPRLLQEGKKLCGYEMQGYWCDVGSLQDYLQAQFDLLSGKVQLPHPSGVAPTAKVHPSAKLQGRCYIGPDANVGAGAELTDALLFAGSQVQNRSVIRKSCLWQQAFAGEDSFLNQAVLCRQAVARRDSVISERCALGQGAEAASGATLFPGVRIYPFLSTPPDAHVRCSLLEAVSSPSLRGGMLALQGTEEACQLAYAISQCLKPARLLLSAEDTSQPLYDLLCGACRLQGIEIRTLQLPALPVAQTLVPLNGCDAGLHLSGEHAVLLDAQGQRLSDKQWSAVLACMQSGAQQSALPESGMCTPIPDGEQQYLRSILPPDSRPASLSTHFRIFCGNRPLLKLCGKALINAGARYVAMNTLSDMHLGEDEVGLILHENGSLVLPITATLTPSPEQNTLLALQCCRIYHGALFNTHPSLPRSAEIWGKLQPRDASAECQRQIRLLQDGVAMCAHLAPLLDAQSLQHWLDQLPESHIQEQRIPCLNQDKGRVLRVLSQTQLSHQLTEGLHIDHPRGHAAIIPDGNEALIHIRGESRDSEFARELCDFYSRKVRELLTDPPKM